MPGTPTNPRSRLVLLGAGAAAGLLLAATGLVEKWSQPADALPQSMIARVGDHLIPESRYAELLSDLETDKKTPLTEQDRQFVLDRLIDEELLILRGIELGLPQAAPGIRKAIAASVIAQVTADTQATLPDEATLRDFYRANAAFFSTTARYRLRWWSLPDAGPESEQEQKRERESATPATSAVEALRRGEEEATVLHSTGLKAQSFLPNRMLPLTKLADYLGAELALQIPRLATGKYSEPIHTGGSWHILLLEERLAGEPPPFEELRPVVEAEYLRRSGDEALRDYLAWLRQRTEVTVAPGAVQ
jgi:parvulin-like peptidyl-prolyl isomerase